MLKLSPRLEAIFDAVPQSTSICDVGTDHGLLAAKLVISGKTQYATATDINEKPLENARKTLKKLEIEDRVKLILCDGLSGVLRPQADTVIIAGMGGDVISGILSRCDFVMDKNVTLVLQPMTGADTLRIYLAQSGFEVENETAVSDNGKIYSVMTARFGSGSYEIDDVRQKIGILKPDTANSRIYIEKQKNICEKCALDLKKAPNKQELYTEMSTLSLRLKEILEENNGV